MSNRYILRKANDSNDCKNLCKLYGEVFTDEPVDTLTDILFHHHPNINPKNWYLIEDPSKTVVSGCALIPWEMDYMNITLKIGELGIVATLPKHQGNGLMTRLVDELNRELENEKYDLSVIQGIPGFYQRYGYRYALPMENHFNIFPEHLAHLSSNNSFAIRKANNNDIPVLQSIFEADKKNWDISCNRDLDIWKYLFSHSMNTEYGADFYVVRDLNDIIIGYFRIARFGFGKGLIINEVSNFENPRVFNTILKFFEKKMLEQKKPYIRLNLSADHVLSQYCFGLGVKQTNSYAWQIKVVNKLRFLNKIAPALQERLSNSELSQFDGNFILSFYRNHISFDIKNGIIENISECREINSPFVFCMPDEFFEGIVLGYSSWKELQTTRPDIAPMEQFTGMAQSEQVKTMAVLMDILFPATKAWLYPEY